MKADVLAQHWTDYHPEERLRSPSGSNEGAGPEDWLFCACGAEFPGPRKWAEHVLERSRNSQ